MKQLTIVMPCFNEEAVIREACARIKLVLDRLVALNLISADSSIFFVDDGSSDRSWSLIQELCSQYNQVHGIKLSKNCGHQNALLAGLLNAPGDALISLDADLQDDPNIIEKMVRLFDRGIDIVFAVRSSRHVDTLFKRLSAEGFYLLMDSFGVESIKHHADFRLMSRRTVNALSLYGESNLFLRGIIPQLGFPTAIVTYERQPRWAGETKYSLRRMFSFALNGITSFSIAPLRAISFLGIVVSIFSFSIGIGAFAIRLFTDIAAPGWASTVIPLSFLGGVQLLSIGILGEYIGKTYLETKKRPRYIIEEIL
jgi:glycosyltransferase involved in cell wall biosynthesis